MGRRIKNRVGETNTTNDGLTMKIVSYTSSTNMDVEFVDWGVVKESVSYSNFKRGQIKCPLIEETRETVTTCTNPNVNNFSFIVDTEDLPKVHGVLWSSNKGYVYNKKKGRLHKILMPTSGKGEYVDHVDGNRQNNRKDNLRVCSHIENSRNIHHNRRNTSGYKGVWWDKRHKKWRAGIGYNGKNIKLGYFVSKEEAAKAYNHAATKFFGQYACLNNITEGN